MQQPGYLEPYSFRKYGTARKIWRILYPFLIFIGVQLLFSFLGVFAGGMIVALGEYSASPDALLNPTVTTDKITDWTYSHLLHITILYQVAALAVFIPMWLKTRRYRPATERPNLAMPIVLSALLLPGISLLASTILSISGLDEMSDAFMEMMQSLEDSSIYLQIISVVILAPLVEELCFRGIILNRCLYWMPKWAALAVQAVLFGIIHMNLPQGIFAAVIGFIIGLLYIRYRSVWVCISAHLATNAVSTGLNALFSNSGKTDESPAVLLAYGVFLVISIAAAVVVFKTRKANILPVPQAEPVFEIVE